MNAPALKVVPVLISAELFPFSLMESGQMQIGIDDLNTEVDSFLEDRGVKTEPALYIDTTTVWGTAHLPHDHVPYVQVTTAVSISGMTHDEVREMMSEFEPESFPYFKVRILTANDVQLWKQRFSTDQAREEAAKDAGEEAPKANATEWLHEQDDIERAKAEEAEKAAAQQDSTESTVSE